MVSIILALGGIAFSARPDALKDLASSHPAQQALTESIIGSHWPAFASLTEDDRQHWVTASWLLGIKAHHSAADDPFSKYVKSDDKYFGLGQMLKTLGFAQHPRSSFVSSFAAWLKCEHPSLLAGLAQLRTERIGDFRNREDHPDVRLIQPHEADECGGACRAVIDLLQKKRISRIG